MHQSNRGQTILKWILRPVSPAWMRYAPVPLRLIVGYGFMEHGFAKLLRGTDSFPIILQAIGVPAPHFMAWCTILIEIFGGLAILLGAFVALASIPMAVVLLVATFTVHWQYGFSSIKLQEVTAAGAHFGQPGYECDLLYLACLAALVLGGSGPWAIDNVILKQLRLADTPTADSAASISSREDLRVRRA